MILPLVLLIFAPTRAKGSAIEQCHLLALESEPFTVYSGQYENLTGQFIWYFNKTSIYNSYDNPPILSDGFSVDLSHPWRWIRIEEVQRYHSGTFMLFATGRVRVVWTCVLEVLERTIPNGDRYRKVSASIENPSYVLEVYFVVDRKAINRYEDRSTASSPDAKLSDAKAKMMADIDYIITEMNTLYKSLSRIGEDSFDIKIARRDVEFLDNNLFPEDNILVDATDGLHYFNEYLTSGNASQRLQFDVSLLWTGFNLFNEQINIPGLAHQGVVCRSYNTSTLVEFTATYDTVVTTAHMLAHNLGAGHDTGLSTYIMGTGSGAETDNRRKFSRCTAIHIIEIIDKLSPNCLLNTSTDSVIPSSNITDNFKDVNTLCQHAMNNTNSYMCMENQLYQSRPPAGDTVCDVVYCHGTDHCYPTLTPDGIFCRKGKSCRLGKCVDDPRPEAQAVDDTCVFGDQTFIAYANNNGTGYDAKTCSQLLMYDPLRCNYRVLQERCCASCNQLLNTGIPRYLLREFN